MGAFTSYILRACLWENFVSNSFAILYVKVSFFVIQFMMIFLLLIWFQFQLLSSEVILESIILFKHHYVNVIVITTFYCGYYYIFPSLLLVSRLG